MILKTCSVNFAKSAHSAIILITKHTLIYLFTQEKCKWKWISLISSPLSPAHSSIWFYYGVVVLYNKVFWWKASSTERVRQAGGSVVATRRDALHYYGASVGELCGATPHNTETRRAPRTQKRPHSLSECMFVDLSLIFHPKYSINRTERQSPPKLAPSHIVLESPLLIVYLHIVFIVSPTPPSSSSSSIYHQHVLLSEAPAPRNSFLSWNTRN